MFSHAILERLLRQESVFVITMGRSVSGMCWPSARSIARRETTSASAITISVGGRRFLENV